jgi:hypothetical protein
MAFEYYFMWGTERLSQKTADRVAKDWGLRPEDHFCDWCERRLTSKRNCDAGPHPWRIQFMGMGNPMGDEGDLRRQVGVGEQMTLVPLAWTLKNNDGSPVKKEATLVKRSATRAVVVRFPVKDRGKK